MKSINQSVYAGLAAVQLLGTAMGQFVSLPTVPVTACAGNPAGATATYTTHLMEGPIANLQAGDIWNQPAATWVFSNGQGVKFIKPFYDVGPLALPEVDSAAITLDPASTAWTFVVPTSGQPQQIQWQVATASPTGTGVSTARSPISTSQKGTISSKPSSPISTSQKETISSKHSSPISTSQKGSISSKKGSISSKKGSISSKKGSISSKPSSPISTSQKKSTSSKPSPASTGRGGTKSTNVPSRPIVGMPNKLHTFVARRSYPIQRGLDLHPRAASQYSLTIKGIYPCASDPAFGLQSNGASGTPNPTVASACHANAIPTSASAYSAYSANAWMASVLSSATPPGMTGANVAKINAAQVFKTKVGANTVCNYDSFCNPLECGQIHNAGADVAQAFLSYISLQNLNNYLNAFYEAFQSPFVLGTTADITNTFFTDTSANPTWEQILLVVGPLLGAVSAGLGALGPEAAVAAAGVLGVVGGAAVVAANGANAAASGVFHDQSYQEFGNIQNSIAKYLSAASHGVASAYNVLIAEANVISWCGSNVVGPSDPGHYGIMGQGIWTTDYSNGIKQSISDNVAKIIIYKTINWAWKDSLDFIVFMPWGTKTQDSHGNSVTVTPDYCKQNMLGSSLAKGTITCDYKSGMAGIFNGNSDTAFSSGPTGYNSKYTYLGETFSTIAAVEGSVASWEKGGYNYDLAAPFQQQLTSPGGTLTTAQLTELQALKVAPDTAGFFNIPVCPVTELAYWPVPGAAFGLPVGCPSAFRANVSPTLLENLGTIAQLQCGNLGAHLSGGKCCFDLLQGCG